MWTAELVETENIIFQINALYVLFSSFASHVQHFWLIFCKPDCCNLLGKIIYVLIMLFEIAVLISVITFILE